MSSDQRERLSKDERRLSGLARSTTATFAHMRILLHHLDLIASDPVASRSLYEPFLGHCGFTLKSAGFTWAGFGLGHARYPCITIMKAKGDGATRKRDR